MKSIYNKTIKRHLKELLDQGKLTRWNKIAKEYKYQLLHG